MAGDGWLSRVTRRRWSAKCSKRLWSVPALGQLRDMKWPGHAAVMTCVAMLASGVWVAVLPSSKGVAADGIWSEPLIVFGTTGFAANPILLADSAGDVHLFFTTAATDNLAAAGTDAAGAIMYSRLHDRRFSPPIEVLLTPDG